MLSHESEYIRSWAVQLMAVDKEVSDAGRKMFSEMAHSESSALVRLYLASSVQRLEPAQRWEILEALVQRDEDNDDHNLPLMLWYATEPMIELDMKRAMDLAVNAKSPNILPFTIKKVSSIGTEESDKLLRELEQRLGKLDSHRYHEAQSAIRQSLESRKK